MRAACYLRISNDKTGDQLGVTRQREDCERLCTKRGWTPVEYMDNDISASSGKRRPAYEAMLADIQAGEIGAVVVWDLDRLHRRPIELERFMEIADTHHVALASVNGDVDLGTEQGRFFARMKGNVAAYEIGQMKARQCRKHEQNAASGLPHWRVAFGYAADGSHQPDPATAPLVRDGYNAILTGASLSDVARTWNAAGASTTNGKPWTAPMISAFIRKPRNAGKRSYRGKIVGDGTWPPLVDPATWASVQLELDSRPGRPTGKRARRHLLTGVLHCGKCPSTMTAAYTNTGTITYACKACRGVSVRAEHVEPMLFDLVAGRLAQPDAVDLLKAEIHDAEEAEKLREQENVLLARLDEIADERADGLLTGEQAKRATDRITGQLDDLRRRQQSAARLRLFADLPLGKPEVRERVRQLSPDRYRAVLGVLMTVTIAPVGKGGKTFRPERVRVTWK